MNDDSHPFRARIRIELESEFPEILDTSLPAYYTQQRHDNTADTQKVTPPPWAEALAKKYNIKHADAWSIFLGCAIATCPFIAQAMLDLANLPEEVSVIKYGYNLLFALGLWYLLFWLLHQSWVRRKIDKAQEAVDGRWILDPEKRAEHLRKQIKDPEQLREHIGGKLGVDLGKRTGDAHHAIDKALRNMWYERLEREKNLRRQAIGSAAWHDTKQELAALHTREAKLIDQLVLIEQLREDLLLDVGEYASYAEQVINHPEEVLQDVERLRELIMMKYRRLNAALRGECILPDLDLALLEAARGPRAAQKAAAND